MKKNSMYLFIIFILAVSCTKSRFATTTRHDHDGKVAYMNHYSSERMNLNRHRSQRPSTPPPNVSAKTAGNAVGNPATINKMDFIASSDKNFLILNNVEKLVSQSAPSLFPEFHREKELTQFKHPCDTLAKDLASVSSSGISQGDSNVVKKKTVSKENAAGTEKMDDRKTETLGLIGFILSFLGMIPLIGIPFAVLAIIFGTIGIKKIRRNPKKYKGKGFAIASIVIGCAMMVMNIIIIASSISAASKASLHNLDSSSSCHV